MNLTNHTRANSVLTGGLIFILALTLVACGTFQVSVQVQGVTPTPSRAELSNYVFADDIVLRGYSLPDLDVMRGVETPFRLYWTVKVKPRINYALNLQLRDADGMLVWSAAPAVIWGPGPSVTEMVLYFPWEIAPGDYSLEIVLYDPNGSRAPVKGPNQEGAVRLANLRLLPGGAPSPQHLGTLVTPIVTRVITATVRP